MTSLHRERIDCVLENLLESRARSVLDLGCGRGLLLARLLRIEQFERVAGVDSSLRELSRAEDHLRAELESEGGRLSLIHGSYTERDERLVGFDAVAMVETIEHVDPRRLSMVERAVFGSIRPKTVVMTTPNRDYNAVHAGLGGRFRHPDHRFEWSRAKFETWAAGVADRAGFRVDFRGIGRPDRAYGCPTQMARFSRVEGDRAAGG